MTSPPNCKMLSDLLPPGWIDKFSEPCTEDGRPDEAGLYFSSYVGWHRLLRLPATGPYLLLLWCVDRNGRIMPDRTRSYSGGVKLTRFTATGDRRIDLDMSLAGKVPSSDLWDASLYVAGTGRQTRLLRKNSAKDLSVSIGWNSTLGKSERYFTRMAGLDAIPDLRSEGAHAPCLDELPSAIRRLIPAEPIRARIVGLGAVPTRREPETTPIIAIIDKGAEDGVQHNMPFASPAGMERPLIGWCSAPEPNRCTVRIRVQRGQDGKPVNLPMIDDELTSRAPSAPPMV